MLRHKFNAVSCESDGVKFPSKLERSYFIYLQHAVKTGKVVLFLRQPSFDLPGKSKYRADFLVFFTDGTVEFWDCKGMMTASSKMKIKMVEDLYPIKIKIMK